MTPRRPTLTEVAAQAGVDRSLASRVLRGDPRGFASPDTRRRIHEAAEILGYRVTGPRPVARSMTIGLLLPGFSSPVYTAVARGVEEQARTHGYGMVLGTHVDGDARQTLVEMLRHGQTDALLVASGHIHDDALRELVAAARRPVVLVNRQVAGIAASVVLRDGDAAALAVDHLADLGHEHLAGLFGGLDLDTTRRRRHGFIAACGRRGITPTIVETDDRGPRGGSIATRKALEARPSPTALVAGTFPIGVGALAALRDEHRTAPDEVSVVSVHDDALADYLVPRLTTVALPAHRLGVEAVELALALDNGGLPRRVVVPDGPELVLRSSTACAP